MPREYFDPTRNVFYDGFGLEAKYIHQETDECHRRGCCIHSPSDHPMVGFLRRWVWSARYYGAAMMRVCPCGVDHPDPDHVTFIRQLRGAEAARDVQRHECCPKKCCEK